MAMLNNQMVIIMEWYCDNYRNKNTSKHVIYIYLLLFVWPFSMQAIQDASKAVRVFIGVNFGRLKERMVPRVAQGILSSELTQNMVSKGAFNIHFWGVSMFSRQCSCLFLFFFSPTCVVLDNDRKFQMCEVFRTKTMGWKKMEMTSHQVPLLFPWNITINPHEIPFNTRKTPISWLVFPYFPHEIPSFS